ncbi:peptidylprolyl isomerase [Endozoicomonas euniceicola]|uniref:Peptidyl-prolyl cis-trans isomerase n=2 Tax=Endozoicomonas euniceicola TaxID=1234143 RepID=A0ABY6H1W4_9GAMM|nr:peptidylprolyl isomerase [Endozoicomonas euniceicola]
MALTIAFMANGVTASPEVPSENKNKEDIVQVQMETSKGNIVLQLDEKRAPVTVKNFLRYVDEGFYDNLIFHRVINGFMIQGGGMDKNMTQKPTKAPIYNESSNGLANRRGTIAMARTSAPHSATSQFFINLEDNNSLNYRTGQPGYAVFGHVVKGMDVVDAIAKVRTGRKAGHSDVPVEPVFIIKADRVQAADKNEPPVK